jgi:hypothetical protein
MSKKSLKQRILIIIIFVGISFSIILTFSPLIKDNFVQDTDSKLDNSGINLANQGFVNSSGQEVFWFIHITDTQDLWYAPELIARFNRLLNESYKVIQPVIIYNTGDIVSSDYENFISANERNQRVEEWEAYNKSLNDNNMNGSVYLDVVGNHDCYGDPGNTFFLQYSMMGQAYNALQYSSKKSFSFGEYAFIGLHTGEDYGVTYPFGLFGYLNSQELDWYEEELEKVKDCEKIFVFGHHPPFEIFSGVNSNGKSFFSLNDEYNVFAYFTGHGHMNTFENVNGMFAIETTAFDRPRGSYRIVAVDNNHLSTSLETVGTWPQGIITYPPREDYINEDLNNIQKIRALAWDPNGISAVQWSAYSGANQLVDWTPMVNVTNNRTLWEANWDTTLNDGNDYLIKVKIIGKSGETIKEIFYSYKKSFYMNLYQLMPIFYTSFFAFVGLVLVGTYYRRNYIPKYKKREEQKVDKRLRNLYLLKCLIFFAVPLTLGGMYIGQVTTVFSLFHVNVFGIHINGLQFIYGGAIFMFGLFWQGFRLAYDHRKDLTVVIGISIFFTGFMILFYILHFPALSWFSPGLYLMLIIDFYMLKRNIEMKRETRK